MGYRYFRTYLVAITLILCGCSLFAQPQDIRLSVEPGPGNSEQRWPGVIIQNGQLRVRWGELRKAADTNIKVPQVWYVLGHWAGRGEGGMLVVNAFRPAAIEPDPGAGKTVIAPTGFEQPREFDGGVIAGSMQWRADLGPAPGGTDTVYKANYSVYVLQGDNWKRTTIYENKGSRLTTLRSRAYAYDPVRGEYITAWITGNNTVGRVTAVDSNGAIVWNFEDIPLPVARFYHIIPIRDREFIIVQDSTATRYVNGVASGTSKFSMELGMRFQRIPADRFVRSFVGPDTAHYTMEVYGLDGTRIHTKQVFRPNSNAQPSHFLTTNREELSFALIMAGADGVYATVMDSSLVETMPTQRVSRGTDSAFSPSAVFYGDTLYVAWQDNRNTIGDIYGRAFATGTVITGVDPEENSAAHMGFEGIAPNPAVMTATVQIDMATAGHLKLELVDPVGRTVRKLDDISLPEGRSAVQIDVAGLPAGAYSLVARSGRATAVTRLIVMH